jgi:3-deoxy-D-arabino-heptulosonate 7-phosphate (DAHP) synthase class II
MAIFTLAEIETQIAAYKAALLAVANGKSFQMQAGGSARTWTSEDTPEIRRTLEWLDSERTRLTIGSGPQILVGRPAR